MFDTKNAVINPGPHDMLSIGLDTEDDDWDNPTNFYPMMLYVPHRSRPEHNHIPLTKDQARILRDWLTRYLEEG